METALEPRVGIGFLLLWIIANAGGWIIGIFGGFVFTIFIADRYNLFAPGTLGFFWIEVFAIGAVLGTVMGMLQQLALYRHWYRFAQDGEGVFQMLWVATSAASGAISLVVTLVVLWNAINQNQAIAGGIAGSIVGLAQWFVLKRYVRNAGWWIIANSIGWAVTSGGFATGFGAGVITGITLLWLMRRTPHKAQLLTRETLPTA